MEVWDRIAFYGPNLALSNLAVSNFAVSVLSGGVVDPAGQAISTATSAAARQVRPNQRLRNFIKDLLGLGFERTLRMGWRTNVGPLCWFNHLNLEPI